MMNPTKVEKDRERRRRDEKEREKQRKEEEEKKKKTKPETPAVKYGKNLCKYAWRGNVKRCIRCIRKGASVEFAHPISLSRPLHRAALGGSLETVMFLVKEQKAMLNVCDDEEWRPLHFAASKGHTEICKFLVQSGAEIGAKDAAGNTALHLAAAKGHAETVEVLVSLGASPMEQNAAGKFSETPLDGAASRRIARTLQGLGRDLEEERAELRGIEQSEAPVKANEGEFFDATKLYGLTFSDEEMD